MNTARILRWAALAGVDDLIDTVIYSIKHRCIMDLHPNSVRSGTAKKASSACPKCGTSSKSGKRSCCVLGGAWFKNCGDAGDRNFGHTWAEGIQACKSKLCKGWILRFKMVGYYMIDPIVLLPIERGLMSVYSQQQPRPRARCIQVVPALCLPRWSTLFQVRQLRLPSLLVCLPDCLNGTT